MEKEKWHDLYVVATPIGNLGDMTLRALEVLKSVGCVLCEDTRVTSRLLSHFDIKAKAISYHQHSGRAKVESIIRLLRETDCALVTDAGTPGISDPGNMLVRDVDVASGGQCRIIPVPGVSAVTAALSVSGLPTDKFLFLGFLPHKKGRETMMRQVADSEVTTVFYESTHRIAKCLEQLSGVLGDDREVVVCRELTKKFETIYRGTAGQILAQINEGVSKGEFVIVVSGRK